MKKTIYVLVLAAVFTVFIPHVVSAQSEEGNLVNVTSMKTKWPEKGSIKERDSLVAIYNNNVVKKNEKVLSHREYAHYFTANSSDYMIIEEYKDYAEMEASWKLTGELEKKAWPDENKRKDFMKAMGAYFESWHGDALYKTDPALSKN